MTPETWTIGFSNMSETIPFAVLVREGLEEAVAAHPNLKLIVRDNAFDNDLALANAREFVELGVNLAIVYHIDERQGMQIKTTLTRAQIPVIAVDIPIPMSPFFGIDNRMAGYLAGEALGKWVKAHWDGKLDKVLVMTEMRAVSAIRERVAAAVEGLGDNVPLNKDDIMYANGGTQREVAREYAALTLSRWPDVHRIGVICTNDDTAMGVLDAARDLGRESDLAVIGQGANLAPAEFENPQSRFIASTAYYPERYGAQLVDLALRMLRGERVPNKTLVQPVCLTAENYKDEV